MTTQTPTQPRPDWTEALDRNRQNVSYVLIGLGGVLILASAVLVWKFGWESAAAIVGCVLFGLTSLALGLWFASATTGGLSGKDSSRLLALMLGGVLGLVLTIAAVWQTVPWWKYVSGGTEVWQGPDWWRIWVLAALFLVGLAVLFLSLLLGRGEESDDPLLRRLLYGYNAVLTGLLFLGVLVALNVLAYLYLPVSSDWTKAGIYTLGSKSEMLLKNLQQPVTVYVMEQQRGSQFDTEMRDLMDNAHNVTSKIQAEYLIRDLNITEMKKLKEKYKPDDDLGLIVVYGDVHDDHSPHSFIPMREILPPPAFDPRTGRPSRSDQQFKGEDKLMAAIASLEEGKKPVLYFTQGNGELDLFGLLRGAPPERRGQALLDRLQQRDNYDVKGLMLGVEGPAIASDPRIVVAKTVPDDAAVVVVAGPTKPLSQGTIDALKAYMAVTHKEKDPADPTKDRQRKGKLMVLAGVVAGPDDRMLPLGLDRLLADYDVNVSADRVLRAKPDQHPEGVVVSPNPDLKGKNPLATLFEDKFIIMNELRVVRPGSAAPRPGEPPPFQSVELISTAPPIIQQSYVIADPDLRPGVEVMSDYFEKRRDELRRKLAATLPVAVAVSETSASDPRDPHAFMGGGRGEGAPRVVVIGDSAFASNAALGGRAGNEAGPSTGYDLFASALAWLREKPSSMGIEPKDRGSYAMQASTNFTSMLLAPFGLMSLSVLGLGLGVWVVRRR